MGVEVLLSVPGGPGDAGHLVGESDGGNVVSAPFLGLEGPGSEAIGVLASLGVTEDGAGSVNEQHAEVDVSAFVNVSETTDTSGRELLGDEPEKAGEASSRGESSRTTDEGHEGGSGEETDPGDGAQPSDILHLYPEGSELGLDSLDSTLEIADLLDGISEDGGKGRVDGVVVEPGGDLRDDPFCADGDGEPELSEKTADGVEASGTRGHPAGAQTVE